ncbi:MAG TPA: type II secretion system protein GspM [Geminicoccus sp.]|uniref:type II secretion system protein GspM n=1 Tax=Geminicoccus sp. TaxID=2024832 RepID=UPI002E2F16E0|nr:type II secretion system protein GspM [Geminicoccus sp.]HEX2529767.1 type II secretion system protein GspM [Geminicoccus sp.]
MNALLQRPGIARVLALAILACVVAAAIGSIVTPLWLIDRQHRKLAESETRLRVSHAELAERLRTAQADEIPELQGTIEAESPSLAGGIIQELVGNTVLMSGGELRSAELLPTHAEDGFTAVPIRVTFNGDSLMLREFLYRIETSSPVLVVDRLDVTAEQNMDDTSNPWQGDVQIAAEIVGWMRSEAPP